MKKHLKTILAIAILVTTFGAFAYYIHGHPAVWWTIKATHPGIIAALLALYAVWFLAQVLMTRFSLKMYDKSMGKQENLLFNAYSSLINFFGPGQSAPIFRGLYLKKRHDMTIKQYLFTMLIYYGFYSVISACFLLVGNRPWWQTALAMIAAAGGSIGIIRWYQRKKMGYKTAINMRVVVLIFGATLLQLIAQAGIYAVELHSSGAEASLGQVLSYTGAANFALFVALTPGAIGIREAFLVFTQHLHAIPNILIVTANVLDRAVYLLFLGGLFVLTLSLHAKDKLKVAQLKSTQDN
jgi:uncharacterized membrane protein YbhN (UPF0104 family)